METTRSPSIDSASSPTPHQSDGIAPGSTSARIAGRVVANLIYAMLLAVAGLAASLPGSALLVSDALVHGVAYGVQTLLLFWMLRAVLQPLNALLGAVLGAGLYGALVEALQFLQPTRAVEAGDLAANFAGVGVGCAVILVFRATRADP